MGHLRYERSTIPQPHKRGSDFKINLAAQNACHYQNQYKKRQPRARQEKSHGIFQWPCPTAPRLDRYCLGRLERSYNTDETVAILSKSLCNKDCKGKSENRWGSDVGAVDHTACQTFRLCCFVQDVLKGVIPKHLDVFSSAMSQQHGYSTRNGYMPKVSRPRMRQTKHIIKQWTIRPYRRVSSRDWCQKRF